MGIQQIEGKVVVVTGASRGIGALLSERLAGLGATVAMLARNSTLMEEICTRIRVNGGMAACWTCDVANPNQVNRAMGEVNGKFGNIDVLVNNAAIEKMMPLEELDLDKVREMFETNVFGVINCIKAVLPVFLKQGSGHIINIASLAGVAGTRRFSAYCASKGAIVKMSEACRRELAPKNIYVTTVFPYYTATEMTLSDPDPVSTRFPGIPLLLPDRAAAAVAKIIQKPKKELWIPWYVQLILLLANSSPALSDFLTRVLPEGRPRKGWKV